jgi:hypothetical protein
MAERDLQNDPIVEEAKKTVDGIRSVAATGAKVSDAEELLMRIRAEKAGRLERQRGVCPLCKAKKYGTSGSPEGTVRYACGTLCVNDEVKERGLLCAEKEISRLRAATAPAELLRGENAILKAELDALNSMLKDTIEANRASARCEIGELKDYITDLEEVLEDKRRLTREIDVILHGDAGAAKTPSLSDVAIEIKRIMYNLGGRIADLEDAVSFKGEVGFALLAVEGDKLVMVERERENLRARCTQLSAFIAEYENDCACLPEDVSVTEYVGSLHEQLKEAEKEKAGIIAERDAVAKDYHSLLLETTVCPFCGAKSLGINLTRCDVRLYECGNYRSSDNKGMVRTHDCKDRQKVLQKEGGK